MVLFVVSVFRQCVRTECPLPGGGTFLCGRFTRLDAEDVLARLACKLWKDFPGFLFRNILSLHSPQKSSVGSMCIGVAERR